MDWVNMMQPGAAKGINLSTNMPLFPSTQKGLFDNKSQTAGGIQSSIAPLPVVPNTTQPTAPLPAPKESTSDVMDIATGASKGLLQAATASGDAVSKKVAQTEGINNAVGGAVGAGANMILPGLGAIAGPATTALMGMFNNADEEKKKAEQERKAREAAQKGLEDEAAMMKNTKPPSQRM